jgi:hypothetical protein
MKIVFTLVEYSPNVVIYVQAPIIVFCARIGSEDMKSKETYQRLVEHVLVKMHEQKQVVTPTDVSNYTVEKCDRIIEVLFLTKEQQAIAVCGNLKRIVFISDFGTGKTTLLKLQAKMQGNQGNLNSEHRNKKRRQTSDGGLFQQHRNEEKHLEENSSKIFFIVFLGPECLLLQDIHNNFLDYTNVSINHPESSGKLNNLLAAKMKGNLSKIPFTIIKNLVTMIRGGSIV